MRTREEMLAIKIPDIATGSVCGPVMESTGRRMQKHKGQWLSELVFLSDRDPKFIQRIWETREGTDDAWIKVITTYLNWYGFKHPVPTLYCYNCDSGIVTSRKLELTFNLDIVNAPVK